MAEQRMYKVVVVFNVPAHNPYDALDVIAEKVRPFKELVEKAFLGRDQADVKPTGRGWLRVLGDQILGK